MNAHSFRHTSTIFCRQDADISYKKSDYYSILRKENFKSFFCSAYESSIQKFFNQPAESCRAYNSHCAYRKNFANIRRNCTLSAVNYRLLWRNCSLFKILQDKFLGRFKKRFAKDFTCGGNWYRLCNFCCKFATDNLQLGFVRDVGSYNRM